MIDPRREELAALAALGWTRRSGRAGPRRRRRIRRSPQPGANSPSRRRCSPARRRSRAAPGPARPHPAPPRRASPGPGAHAVAASCHFPRTVHALRAGRVPDGPRPAPGGASSSRSITGCASPAHRVMPSGHASWRPLRPQGRPRQRQGHGGVGPRSLLRRGVDGRHAAAAAGPRLPALGARSLQGRRRSAPEWCRVASARIILSPRRCIRRAVPASPFPSNRRAAGQRPTAGSILFAVAPSP